MSEFIYPLLGGILIGIAVTLMLIFNGRVTGISGIIASSLKFTAKDNLWRYCFIIGMLVGGWILKKTAPEVFINESGRSLGTILIAGALVGYGTVMGSGCTSGHGVCGISRLSVRSLVATVVFIAFGVGTATLINYIGGLQ